MAISDMLSKIAGGVKLAGDVARGVSDPNNFSPDQMRGDFSQMRFGNRFGFPMARGSQQALTRKPMSGGFNSISPAPQPNFSGLGQNNSLGPIY